MKSQFNAHRLRILGGFGSHYFFTGIVYNSRRSRQLEKLYWSRTGGSIHRTIYNIFCEKWVFSLKMYKFVREIWVAADSQRRRNNTLLVDGSCPYRCHQRCCIMRIKNHTNPGAGNIRRWSHLPLHLLPRFAPWRQNAKPSPRC